MFLIDTHCHLDQLNCYVNNYDKIIIDMLLNKLIHIINVVVSIKNFYYIKNLFKKYKKKISLSIGIHPLYIKDYKKIKFIYIYKKIISIINKNKQIVAIGETGLDYKYNLTKLEKKLQLENLICHLNISKLKKIPIIIHCRNSYKDLIKLLNSYNTIGIIHCFSGTLLDVKKILDLGFYISFSGLITFINNKLDKIIKYVPLNKILIETDSPFLTPIPFRGKINNPCFLIYIAKYISNIKKIPLNILIKNITINSIKIFNLKKIINKNYYI